MKLINQIVRARKPYKIICVELGDISSYARLRIGFIIIHKKQKVFNFRHYKSFQISVKCFHIALLMNKGIK